MNQTDPWAGFGGERRDTPVSPPVRHEPGSLSAPSGPCWAVATAGPGSAGATTCAVALATLAGALLVEADCDGGVLGLRYGGWLGRDAPSLASLLASLTDGSDSEAVIRHAQRLPSGVPAVLLTPAAEEAIGPVERLTHSLGALRRALSGKALVLDAGRLRPGTGLRLVRQADAVTIVTHPTAEGVGALLARLPGLLTQVRLLVVLVREGAGRGGYPFANVRDTIEETARAAGGAVVVLPMPDDPRAVAALADASVRRSWSARRSGALAGAAGQLLDALSRVPAASGGHSRVSMAAESAGREAEGVGW